jgi:hypothetical protein
MDFLPRAQVDNATRAAVAVERSHEAPVPRIAAMWRADIS